MTSLAVQLPKELAERIQALARENDHTVSGEIRRAIRNHLVEQLERREREGAKYVARPATATSSSGS